jgi:positive regulator of sigma E activity
MSGGSEGIVLEEHGEYVKVCLKRRRGCKSCALREDCRIDEGGSSGFFNLFFGGKSLEVLALNEAGARPGDRCLIQLRDERSIVKGSFLLYLLPGVLFIGGLLLGSALGERWHLTGDLKVLAQFLGGGTLMLLGFLLATLYGRRRRGEFTPIVTAVLREDRHRP